MSTRESMKLDPYLTPNTTINSKQIKHLNVRAKYYTIAVIYKSASTGFDNSFLAMTQKTHATKGKIDQLDVKKSISICVSKNTIKKVKRQPKE